MFCIQCDNNNNIEINKSYDEIYNLIYFEGGGVGEGSLKTGKINNRKKKFFKSMMARSWTFFIFHYLKKKGKIINRRGIRPKFFFSLPPSAFLL